MEQLAGLLQLLPRTHTIHRAVWLAEYSKKWWSIFSPLSRRWLPVLREAGLRGRKVISRSAHCMSLLIINDCVGVSLNQSREQSHWINPRKHQMNDFKDTVFWSFKLQIYTVTCFLITVTCWIFLSLMTHILGNHVRALSAPTHSAIPSSEEFGCLCSKCGCNPYQPVGR